MADLLFTVSDSDLDLEIESPALDSVQNGEQNIFVGKVEHGDSVGGCNGESLCLEVFGTRTLEPTKLARRWHSHRAGWGSMTDRAFRNISPIQGDLFGGKA